MRPNKLYLTDIVEAAEAIERFIAGLSKDKFVDDELHQSAVLQKLLIIGEAAVRLPASFKDQHPHIPWSEIVGFRNIVIHVYFAINLDIVWETSTVDVPNLRNQVAEILAKGNF